MIENSGYYTNINNIGTNVNNSNMMNNIIYNQYNNNSQIMATTIYINIQAKG